MRSYFKIDSGLELLPVFQGRAESPSIESARRSLLARIFGQAAQLRWRSSGTRWRRLVTSELLERCLGSACVLLFGRLSEVCGDGHIHLLMRQLSSEKLK